MRWLRLNGVVQALPALVALGSGCTGASAALLILPGLHDPRALPFRSAG
jgi:hypothetical protein